MAPYGQAMTQDQQPTHCSVSIRTTPASFFWIAPEIQARRQSGSSLWRQLVENEIIPPFISSTVQREIGRSASCINALIGSFDSECSVMQATSHRWQPIQASSIE